MATDKRIRVLHHTSGSPEVSAAGGFEVEIEIVPLEPELTPPTALWAMDPDALVVIEDDQSESARPLVLATRGRKVNLADKKDLIESAKRAGRSVEIHVFDELA